MTGRFNIHPIRDPLSMLCAGLVVAGGLVGCEPTARGGAGSRDGETERDASAVVTYAFGVSAPAGEVSPSGPLVAELARDPNLGRLTVSDGSPPEGPPAWEFDAEFVFGTVEAFLEWREQPRTRALLDRVSALAPDTAAFRPELSVRRLSRYRSVVGQVGAQGGGREVESVSCNADCSRIDVRYKTRGNDAGGGAPGEGTGDAGDIDAVTLICQPGLAGTIENCTASN